MTPFRFVLHYSILFYCIFILSTVKSSVIVDSNYITALKRTPLLLSEPITNFTKNVYKTLSTDPAYKNENLILSPLSIHSALSMLYYGSPIQTTTNLELTKLLGLNLKPIKSFRNGKYHFLNLFRYYEKSGKEHNAEVSLANRIYLQEGFKPKENYLTLLRQYFLTSADVVDFADPVNAAKQINGFVNKKTNGLIDSIVQPDNIDALTRLILINAIYFKAGWKYPFNPANTFEMPFKLLDGTVVMHEKGMDVSAKFRHGKSARLRARILELPYTNTDLNMYIMIPEEENNLETLNNLAASFDIREIKDILKGSSSQNINVNMPAFESSCEAKMNDLLQSLGAPSMFDVQKANFSLITDDELFVGEVLHKAKIRVDEKGSEAAAVTGISVGVRGYPSVQEDYFNVDQPFIYAIYDTKNELPLFIGRMLNPTIS